MVKTAQDILTFWFETTPNKLWFNPTDAFDAAIRHNFEATAMMLAANAGHRAKDGGYAWEQDVDSHFALIIAMDQFPRNMYRDTPACYAWDDIALAAAQRFVNKGWDLKTEQPRRAFAYMPFMHSEDLDMQTKCVHLVDSRLDDENTLFHAKAHQRLIAQFGRFPHRNTVLGREMTPEESTYLKQGGYQP